METDLSEIKVLLQNHVDRFNTETMDIKESIARIEVHNEYTTKAIKDIEDLKTDRNKIKGALGILSIIGLGGIEEFIRHTFTK